MHGGNKHSAWWPNSPLIFLHGIKIHRDLVLARWLLPTPVFLDHVRLTCCLFKIRLSDLLRDILRTTGTCFYQWGTLSPNSKREEAPPIDRNKSLCFEPRILGNMAYSKLATFDAPRAVFPSIVGRPRHEVNNFFHIEDWFGHFYQLNLPCNN